MRGGRLRRFLRRRVKSSFHVTHFVATQGQHLRHEAADDHIDAINHDLPPTDFVRLLVGDMNFTPDTDRAARMRRAGWRSNHDELRVLPTHGPVRAIDMVWLLLPRGGADRG